MYCQNCGVKLPEKRRIVRKHPSIKKRKNGSIAKELKLFELFEHYVDITAAKRAWITIKAMKRGLNPVMVHAGIKAQYTKLGR